jgi:hypothetical protein
MPEGRPRAAWHPIQISVSQLATAASFEGTHAIEVASQSAGAVVLAVLTGKPVVSAGDFQVI